MFTSLKNKYFYFTIILSFLSCTINEKKSTSDKHFTSLLPEETNITFKNEIESSRYFNVFNYRNFYNGGGVAIGDINNDGLQDIYFTANMKKNKLYLNKGNFVFEDITETAKVGGQRAWSTGVTFVDINADGWMDIYVCNSGNVKGDDKANELFINQKNNVFVEQAELYNLANEGLSTHASFFDYDNDGDLDMYLLNNSFYPISSFSFQNIRHIRDESGGDKLYENQGGKFKNVSSQAGIYGSVIGFGLGVTVGDVNQDSYLDIYVSNDFFERDYLYINNGDGTFSEKLEQQMGHTSLSSMGADMADINNDGYPDIIVTDMLPEKNERFKMLGSPESFDIYQMKIQRGFHFQHACNTLQLNNRNGTFSQISFIAQVARTDWSWGALITDFDNDGFKDIFVSNGVYKDVIDQDFINFMGKEENMEAVKSGNKKFDFEEFERKMPSTPIENYLFKNENGLYFSQKQNQWGLEEKTFSNGAAYGDLDNDGDIDLVLNNLNQRAFVYRNEISKDTTKHYLKIHLLGKGQNTMAIGAKVFIYLKNKILYQELIPARGFQSSVDTYLHFGLGEQNHIDSIKISWPDKTISLLTEVKANQLLTLSQTHTQQSYASLLPIKKEYFFFKHLENMKSLSFRHIENDFNDFDFDPFLLRKLSSEGPKLAKADVNGDGLEDVFVGGARENTAKLFIQLSDGNFTTQNTELFYDDAYYEDTGCAFLDVDNDGDMDLYVGSAGTEPNLASHFLKDRLYINNGKGKFELGEALLPLSQNNTSCVIAADIDNDSDMDLFIGTRSVGLKYGFNPKHQILINNGKGKFIDYSGRWCPELYNLGMVTDAVWTDYNGDGKIDLVVVGDWMPISFFKNDGKQLKPDSVLIDFEKTSGWWNTIKATDLDNDGDMDFIVGNFGKNHWLKTGITTPAEMYVSDFDNNGKVEQIITHYFDEKESHPIILRKKLLQQLNFLKKKFKDFKSYANAKITDVLSPEQIKRAFLKKIYMAESVWIENKGNRFEIHHLPTEVQFAPVFAIEVLDVNEDGWKDIILGGNFYSSQTFMGRNDASQGWILLGSKEKKFTLLYPDESHFSIQGEVRDFLFLDRKNKKPLLLVAKNNDFLQVFEQKKLRIQ